VQLSLEGFVVASRWQPIPKLCTFADASFDDARQQLSLQNRKSMKVNNMHNHAREAGEPTRNQHGIDTESTQNQHEDDVDTIEGRVSGHHKLTFNNSHTHTCHTHTHVPNAGERPPPPSHAVWMFASLHTIRGFVATFAAHCSGICCNVRYTLFVDLLQRTLAP
jgi:hypothetical protein